MGNQTDRAFEIPNAGMILNESSGFFVAIGGDPSVDAPDAPTGSIYLRPDGSWYNRTTFSGSGVLADWQFHPAAGAQGRVQWLNLWAPGTYEKNDMVRDGDWTMVANKQTTDKPAPVTEGDPAFELPDLPTWATVSQSGLRITGVQFTIADISVVDRIRVWTENIDVDTEYFFQFRDVTNPATPQIIADGPIPNTAVGWVEVDIGTHIFAPGQVFQGLVFQRKETSASSFLEPWVSLAPDNTPADPGAGNFFRNQLFNSISISKTDDNAADRSVELATLVAGDNFDFNEQGSTRRVENYTIVSATDNGTWIEFAVTLDFTDQLIREGRTCDVFGEHLSGFVAIDIPFLLDEWLSRPGVDGFNVTDPSLIAAGLDDNAYGFDVQHAVLTVSPDWDLAALIGNASVASSGDSSAGVADDENHILAGRVFG